MKNFITTTFALFLISPLFYSCSKEENFEPAPTEIGELKLENLTFLDSNIPIDFYNDLTFTDENTGYAVSRTGKIVKTIDGGQTWTLLNSTVNFYLSRIQFINENVGFATGGDSGGSYFLKTTNAGETWTVVNLNSTENGYPNGMYFKNENEGYIVGFKLFLKTIDGGVNWSTVLTSSNDNFTDVKFKDNTHGFVAFNTSDFYETTNGGTSWQLVQSTGQNNFEKIYFAGDKTLLKSGNILVDVLSNNSTTLPNAAQKLLFLNESKCVAIGQHYETGFFPYGDIFLTNDSWNTFLQETYPPFTELMDISAIAKINNHKVMIIGRGASNTRIVVLNF